MHIRPAIPADFAAVLALNAESVAVLSPLDAERLHLLHRQAHLLWVVEDQGQVIAFLLTFREGSEYDSANYRWFSRRYPKFLYVDRVVVAVQAHARGAGSMLYRELLALAATAAVPTLTCEYDVEPPNPVSARFHARFGFCEVGRQWVAGGKKCVSLQALALAQRADGAPPAPGDPGRLGRV